MAFDEALFSIAHVAAGVVCIDEHSHCCQVWNVVMDLDIDGLSVVVAGEDVCFDAISSRNEVFGLVGADGYCGWEVELSVGLLEGCCDLLDS